ncbi:MAG: MFS transporter [Bacteroidota bacterium]
MQTVNKAISRKNFYAFIWHALLLAVAKNAMDVDTVIPSMLINAGGTQLHVGILTAIMIGVSRFSQLFFAPMVSGAKRKKPFLLGGINMRILSLVAIGFLFLGMQSIGHVTLIALIFIIFTIFSISGAFANLPYTDILGKSIRESRRKQFFSLKQIISSSGILASAFFVRIILARYDYPDNYSRLFFYAAGFLFLASLGFWAIREFMPKDFTPVKQSFRDSFVELGRNRRLQYFLISINTLGLGIGILPFVLLYAGETRELNSEFVGNLLIAKTVGLIVAGLWLFYRSKKVRYHRMMQSMVVLGIGAVAIAWAFPGIMVSYLVSLFTGGLFLSLYQIIQSGVLLEISNIHNRSLYTAISGAGSILPVLFPLFGGAIIGLIGYHAFFAIYAILMATSIIFIQKLNCQK